MDTLEFQQRSVAWSLGASQQDHLSKRARNSSLIRLYQLLLFTMPGTPVFIYGDEIGLQAEPVRIKMIQMFVYFTIFTDVTVCNLCFSHCDPVTRVKKLLRWFGT